MSQAVDTRIQRHCKDLPSIPKAAGKHERDTLQDISNTRCFLPDEQILTKTNKLLKAMTNFQFHRERYSNTVPGPSVRLAEELLEAFEDWNSAFKDFNTAQLSLGWVTSTFRGFVILMIKTWTTSAALNLRRGSLYARNSS
ncbi:hypothetical protein LTS18_004324, partial [Coniosporium uncinatum]